MPELNPFKKEFLKEVFDQKGDFSSKEKVIKLIKDSNVPILGSGIQCVVVEHPSKKEKVVSINYENLSPLGAKDVYYSSKILHILFPHNFPKVFFTSAKQEKEELNGTIREKIVGENFADQNNSNRLKPDNFYPFEKVRKELQTLKLKPYYLPYVIDEKLENFIGTKNNEYYVDTAYLGYFIKMQEVDEKITNIEAISEYMRKNKYSESDITVVISALERLKELYKDNPEQ